LNHGDPVTGQAWRLFLPFDFLIGRTLSRDVTISLEIGLPIVRDYLPGIQLQDRGATQREVLRRGKRRRIRIAHACISFIESGNSDAR
jgi:hypothetical protein